MEMLMAIVIGILFAAGTYLILRPNLIRIVMGLGLYSNAANLLMMACGGYKSSNAAPFVLNDKPDVANMMDPIPPDIILTAIVISFAVGALFLTLCYRVYLDHGTDNPELLPNDELDDETVVAVASDAAPTPALAVAQQGASKAEPAVRAATETPNIVAELAKPYADAPRESVANVIARHAKPQAAKG